MSQQTPRFEQRPSLTIAGQGIAISADPASLIPSLWQRIGPALGTLPGRVDAVHYGLCLRPREAGNPADYVAGCEVPENFEVPPPWQLVRLPANRYAVFAHDGPLSQLEGTCRGIFEDWLPHSGCALAHGSLAFFERYGTNFDASAGQGDIEIWLPVAN